MDIDQGDTSPNAGGSQSHSDDQSQSGSDGEFVLDVGTSKYRDMDAVKAGVQEKDRTIAELNRRLSEIQSQAANSDAIAAIARKLNTPEPQAPKQRDYDAEIAQLAAKLEDAELPEQHVINRKIARLEAEQMLVPKLNEIEALKAQIEEVRKTTAEHDPDWVASKELASQLSQEWGLDMNDPNDRAYLKRMVAKKKAEMSKLPRVKPVSGIGGSSGASSGSGEVYDEQKVASMAGGIAALLSSIGLQTNAADLKKKLARRQ